MAYWPGRADSRVYTAADMPDKEEGSGERSDEQGKSKKDDAGSDRHIICRNGDRL